MVKECLSAHGASPVVPLGLHAGLVLAGFCSTGVPVLCICICICVEGRVVYSTRMLIAHIGIGDVPRREGGDGST